jgi:ATP-dependent protease HslVU (ClpYQ) peptidase subunit
MPKPKPELTTIFGIKCEEGLVMCGDSQTTGEAKESAIKITQIGDHALLGCSGNELYIPLLENTFKDKFDPDSDNPKDYEKSIAESVRAYAREVARDMKAGGVSRNEEGEVPNLYRTDAVLGFSDLAFNTHLYRIAAPYGYRESLKPPFRISVGSGGIYSNFILKNVEEQVFNVVNLGWQDLKIQEVIQFSAFLLNAVGQYEKNTSGRGNFWILSKVSREPHEMTDSEIWGEPYPMGSLRIFIKTVLSHHEEQAKKWMLSYIDMETIFAYFDAYNKATDEHNKRVKASEDASR